MNAPEKPFVCKSEGCKMSFTNEDHLMVHKKKHDMNLNLGIGMKTNIFVADQTPTPTRFIRNCEEVGLFQDLQNVNPFEETFRRATELVKSGNMSVSNVNISNDDTLHTPHVFPLINSNFNDSRNESPTLLQSNTDFNLKTPVIRNEPLIGTNNITNTEMNKNIEFEGLKHDLELEKIQSSMGNDCIEVISMSGLVNHIKTDKKDDASDKPNRKTNTIAKISTKQKLKANILKNKTTIKENQFQILNTVPNIIRLPQTHIPQTVTLAPIVQNPIIVNNPYILGSTNQMYTVIAPPIVQTGSLRAATSKNDEKRKKTPTKSPDEEQRQIIKVRNRAASERARKKHKQWINGLVKQNEAFFKTNANLNNEIKSLREEVATLKKALSAHANCNITKSLGDKSHLEDLINKNNVTQNKKVQEKSNLDTTTVTLKKIRPNIKPLSLPAITLRNVVVHNIPNIMVPMAVQKSQNLEEKIKEAPEQKKNLADIN